ncbi:MAG: anaerobic ribonucleoside-triphosphate reductase activating protein [Elusimicrobiota bacterium]
MLVSGIQKDSLIDWPPRIVSTLFTGGCNFRCPWCHNPGLVNPDASEAVPQEQVNLHFKQRKDWLDGVCISGGEPLLQEGLTDFLKYIKNTGLPVKLDTNGYMPSKLGSIIQQGLVEYIAMDIKAPLDKKKYALACGLKNIDIEVIKESIKIISGSGLDYEFRTTVVPGIINRKSVASIARSLRGADKFVLQNFRSGVTLDKNYTNVKEYEQGEMQEMKKEAEEYIEKVELR